MNTRTKAGRGGRTRHAATRQTKALTPRAPSAFWPLACGAAAAALVFLVAAGYWSPSASVNGAPLRIADGAVALAAAFLLAAALRSLHAGRLADSR
jgi:hypothetical protein